jgi:hypothetical protein
MSVCRWVYDSEVPGGKFLVPGCWNRALNGDDAECQCPDDPETIGDQLNALRVQIETIRREISALKTAQFIEGDKP